MASKFIRFGQINLAGSALATMETPALLSEHGLDVLLVQEQYALAGHLIQKGPDAKAGIIMRRSGAACVVLDHLSNTHCMVVHLEECNMHVVSAYFQFGEPIDQHLHHLDIVLEALRGRRVLICADVNAHSPLWHSDPRHYTGRGHDALHRRTSLEAFISAHNLAVHNVEGQPFTFSGPNGESNIDVTLTTRNVAVDEWSVRVGVSSSDHRLILFRALSGSRDTRAVSTPGSSGAPVRFRDQGVDWPRFRRAIHARMGQINFDKQASFVCRDFTKVISETAASCLGIKGPPKDVGYEWWNPELEKLRKSHCKARCKWQGSRREGGPREERLRAEFHCVRGRYRKAMVEAELEYFRGIAESGNDDPWGLAYRAASGRLRPPPRVLNGIRLAEGFACTVGDAATGLLSVLCPDDDSSRDTPYHGQVRLAASLIPPGPAALPLSRDSLGVIVRSLPNTAPGMDGISARIVKNVWAVAPAEFAAVYGKCVIEGIFPDVWKEGRLLVLPKGNGKPLTDPKAYRPITLLPVLGKILERVILRCAPTIGNRISASQHGFSPGRSTVTALQDIMRGSTESSSKYVQAIFLDISGAFDNAWWPMILTKVKQAGCPPNIFKMLTDYFARRRVGLFVGDRVVWKTSTMGCPQGSVLGPSLWNVLMDDLLRLPLPEHTRMVAYADDVTILIGAQSRAGIEAAAKITMDLVAAWGARNRLGFSPGKSSTMTIRGRLQRAPIVRLAGDSVRSVASAMILGVVLDSSLSFAQHAVSIGERAAKCFGKMARVSASSWGIRYPGLRVLYRGTFVATVTYAAACWYRRATLHVVRSSLLRSQRPSLVLLTKAYRSTSTSALAVLGGVLPADLEVIRAGRLDEERLNGTTMQGDTGSRRRELARRRKEIWNETIDAWQKRWMHDEKGRELFRFFPDVAARLKSHWVAPDYQLSQILTGHGCFRKRLFDMKLCEVSECYCGMEEEDLHHALWVCPLYEEMRRKMMDGISREEAGPIYYGDLVSTPANFARLREFAHSWHKRRSALERCAEPEPEPANNTTSNNNNNIAATTPLA